MAFDIEFGATSLSTPQRCPECGSYKVYCKNRMKQVSDFVNKYGVNIAAIVLSTFGHPKLGKFLLGPIGDIEIRPSVYKCKSCRKVF